MSTATEQQPWDMSKGKWQFNVTPASMSTEIKEPWQTEADAKLAAMEVALKIASEERDALTQESQRLREERDGAQAQLTGALREIERLKRALNAPTPTKPCGRKKPRLGKAH